MVAGENRVKELFFFFTHKSFWSVVVAYRVAKSDPTGLTELNIVDLRCVYFCCTAK